LPARQNSRSAHITRQSACELACYAYLQAFAFLQINQKERQSLTAILKKHFPQRSGTSSFSTKNIQQTKKNAGGFINPPAHRNAFRF
jgi:hypothetical protein